MKRKAEIQEEIKRIAPQLAKVKPQQGFKVPKGYFDKLPEEVLCKAKAGQTMPAADSMQPARSRFDELASWLAGLLQPRMALGLATALLLTVAAWWMWPGSVEEAQPALAIAEYGYELDDEEIEQYIAANIDDFDTQSLFELSYEQEGEADLPEVEDLELDEQTINELLDELEADDLNEWL